MMNVNKYIIILFLQLFILKISYLNAQNRTDLEQKRKNITQQITNTSNEIDKTKKTKNVTANQAQNAKKLLQKQSKQVATISKEVENINLIIERKEQVVISLQLDLELLKNEYWQLLKLWYKQKNTYPTFINWIAQNDFKQTYLQRFYLLKLEKNAAEKLNSIVNIQEKLNRSEERRVGKEC